MILDKIIKNKEQEIKKSKKSLPLNRFKSKLNKSDRNFKKSISKGFNLIAEIKKGSPSKGIINKNFDLEETAKIYEKNKNVRAISVLTDYKFFFMASTCLRTVRKLSKKPLLRKDFIIDEYQIYESRYYGADAVLLIARILTKTKIKNLIELAKKYKMDCLVEIHDENDLKKLPNKVEIIGINNRNLDTLRVDLNTTLNLIKLLNSKNSKGFRSEASKPFRKSKAFSKSLGNSKNFQSKIPKNKIIVTESGYYSNKEIEKVRNKVNAVLIGTSILKSRDINNKINELLK